MCQQREDDPAEDGERSGDELAVVRIARLGIAASFFCCGLFGSSSSSGGDSKSGSIYRSHLLAQVYTPLHL